MSGEIRRTPEELILPSDIHELLDVSLEPAPMRGGTTALFVTEGHPELLIRLNPGNSFEDIRASLQAAHGLRKYGVDVLPARAVEHDGETFVITKRVEGKSLAELLLIVEADEKLLSALDNTYAGLARNLVDAKRDGRPIPNDVNTLSQYMFGAVADETEPKVWLVDLPERRKFLESPDDYIKEVLNIANGIAAIQMLTEKRMWGAQAAVREAIELAEDSAHYGDGIANASAYAIERSVHLSVDDEDKIMGLRTK